MNEYIDEVPQEYQKYVLGIEQVNDGEEYWLISLVGYAEGANTNSPCHVVSGETLKEAIDLMDNCSPCNCDQCKNYYGKEEK